MKKQMKVGLMLMGIFFMTACGPEKTTYQKGFPEQSTPEISQFLQSELIGGEYDYLFTHQETSVYTDHKAIENASYYALQANKLTALYKSLFNNNNPGETFRDLKKKDTQALTALQDSKSLHLPTIEMKKNNMLHIKTDQAEKTFDLPDVLRAFDLTASDRLTFTLYRSNADHFLLRLENIDKKDADKQYMALFFKQDLSRVVPVSDHAAAINQKLADGKLDEFSHLFSNHDKDAHFVKAFQTGERFIVFDSKAKQLKEINKADYLSEDGKYVYINGNKNPLPDGKQQIQTIENYMAGNDKYERTFEISFKKIAKELDLKSAKDTGIAKIVYFNKNLVVLMLQYNAPIAGKAGKTNVIIDLKNKEKPTAYLADLGLQF